MTYNLNNVQPNREYGQSIVTICQTCLASQVFNFRDLTTKLSRKRTNLSVSSRKDLLGKQVVQ